MNGGRFEEDVRAALGTTELIPLTEGGQKIVYSALLEEVPAIVKVVLIPDTAAGTETLERARREVELLSLVDSDYVVGVLSEAVEIGDRPEAVCWVEEYLDGQDVRELVSQFPWPSGSVWSLIRDMAVGLAACHDLDVVHRDLSPGNVRRRSDGRFTLMDPGFARHLAKSALTGVFQPGTPNYMTPEHIPGAHPTPASDVFGVGIIAFHALTGVLPVPFEGDEGSYFRQLRYGQARPVQECCEDVPDELAAVVDHCLQRQPARRYLDARELLADLPPHVYPSSEALGTAP